MTAFTLFLQKIRSKFTKTPRHPIYGYKVFEMQPWLSRKVDEEMRKKLLNLH